MPRKSPAASLALVSSNAGHRLRPPADMPAPERKLFLDIVASVDRDHFRLSDVSLLVQYVTAAVQAEQAAVELRQGAVIDGKPSPWVSVHARAVRAMVSLSTRLRLSPQARRATLPSKPVPPLSYYERQALDEDDG